MFKKHIIFVIIIGLLLNLFVLLINKSDIYGLQSLGSMLERMELTTIDERYKYKAESNYNGFAKNFLIPVIMDDESDVILSQKWGIHPYNRELYARVVDFLNRHGAYIIAFDLVFELDHDGTEEFCKSLKQFNGKTVGATIYHSGVDREKGLSSKDFVKQIGFTENPIYLPIAESFTNTGFISLPNFDEKSFDVIMRDIDLTISLKKNGGKEIKYLGAVLAELYLKKMVKQASTKEKAEYYKKRLNYLNEIYKKNRNYLDIFFTDQFDISKRVMSHDGVGKFSNYGLDCIRLSTIIQEDANEKGILALSKGEYQTAEKYFRESLMYFELNENRDLTKKEVIKAIDKSLIEFKKEIKDEKLKLNDLKIPLNLDADNRPFSLSEQLLGIYLAQYLSKNNAELDIREFLAIEDDFESKLIKNKNFILAPWSVTYQDMYQCPVGKIRGVEIHTTVFQNIMEMSFCKRFDTKFEIVLNFMIGIVVAIGMYLTGIVRSMVLSLLSGLVFIVAVFFGIVWIFLKWGVFLEMTPFFFQSFMTVVLLSTVKYIFEYREQKKVKNILGKYVSPELARELIKNPESLKLGGHEIEGSVIFMDVCSFTSMSEKLEAVEVISLLNLYFEKINRIIFDTGGMLDKFIGDAVMAIYGVFTINDEHARNAIKACLDIKESVKGIDAEPALKFSFGINTGKMVCGNLGSTLRQDFTAIGDTVNTAARLEGVATVDEICVGNNTFELAKDYFEFDGPFFQKVKGKEKEVKFYKVTGFKK